MEENFNKKIVLYSVPLMWIIKGYVVEKKQTEELSEYITERLAILSEKKTKDQEDNIMKELLTEMLKILRNSP